MKQLVRLALLIVATGVAASADAITLDARVEQTSPGLALADLVKAKRLFAPAEFTPAAAAISSDFHVDGYIGTVREMEGFTLTSDTPSPETSVPEPATLVLVGSGLAMAALRRRRAV